MSKSSAVEKGEDSLDMHIHSPNFSSSVIISFSVHHLFYYVETEEAIWKEVNIGI